LPRDATNILFLCLGNICRSPFAELFWNEQLRPQHSLLPHATSAGFYPVADRRTPEKFLPLTTKFGVDLSNHRSRIVNQAMVDEAEIICIMDGDNWLDFIKTYPSAKDKLYFLGAFDDPQAPEIPDPDRLDAHEARPIYERIARSLHALASRLC
jgi:protein-tyrosine phosphatase